MRVHGSRLGMPPQCVKWYTSCVKLQQVSRVNSSDTAGAAEPLGGIFSSGILERKFTRYICRDSPGPCERPNFWGRLERALVAEATSDFYQARPFREFTREEGPRVGYHRCPHLLPGVSRVFILLVNSTLAVGQLTDEELCI